MIIGFDFDNTIIDYSKVFKILINKKIKKKDSNLNKATLKNFLIKNKKENEWTVIQGEVYGKYIIEAKLYKGFIKLFKYLLKSFINSIKFSKLITQDKG